MVIGVDVGAGADQARRRAREIGRKDASEPPRRGDKLHTYLRLPIQQQPNLTVQPVGRRAL